MPTSSEDSGPGDSDGSRVRGACEHSGVLVLDAHLWPNGDATAAESLGRIAIGRVALSTGGDFGDYLVVNLDAANEVVSARLLLRRSVIAGWRDLLWAALDGGESEPVAPDDSRVTKVVAAVRAGQA